MSQFADQTFYEILEISPDSSQEEVHRAFQRAKQTYSPNSPALYSVFSKEEAEELLRLIDEAYSVLSNQSRRKQYDQNLYRKKSSPPLSNVVTDSAEPSEVKAEDLVIPEASSTSWTSTESVGAQDSNRIDPRMTQVSPEVLASNPPPSGGPVGRTRFSHYDIDETMEDEIRNQSVFDGSFMQKVRLYKKVSLDQLSEHTRIGRQYLISIEANDFGTLPAPVFVRGFIRQYAQVLGLNENVATESFMKLFKASRG